MSAQSSPALFEANVHKHAGTIFHPQLQLLISSASSWKNNKTEAAFITTAMWEHFCLPVYPYTDVYL